MHSPELNFESHLLVALIAFSHVTQVHAGASVRRFPAHKRGT